jgi:TRAP-type C4-dicarboxylate transport system permease small subunit
MIGTRSARDRGAPLPGTRARAVLRAAGRIEEVIACTALVIVVAAVVWGVLTRYVTAQPAPWSGEVAAMGFAWVVFAGAAAGFKRGAHVSIDLLTQRLPPRAAAVLGRAVEIGILLFLLYTLWLGIEFTLRNWDNPSPVLRLPLSIIYASVAFGFASMAVRQAHHLILGARRT